MSVSSDRVGIPAGIPEATLDEESRFWGTATRLLLASGAVPYDVDRRRATKIRDREVLRSLGSRRADPQIEELWRGRFADETLAILQNMGARRVLELGCGAGWLALAMARRGLTVDAVDLSEERIEIARQYYRERCKDEELAPVRYHVRNLEVLTPSVGVYDAVVSFTTLHHMKDKAGLIERCYRALPDGGKFIVCDDDRHAGPWLWRGFRGLTILGLSLLLLPLPSPVPRRRRLLEGVYSLAEGVFTPHALQQLRSLASPVLWRGANSSVLARGSPLEGVQDDHHTSLDDLLISLFEDVKIQRGELFGLRHLLVLDMPGPLRATLTRLLNAVDQSFADSAWLPHTLLYAVGTKRLS